MKSELIKRILTSAIMIPIAFFFIIKGSIYFTFLLTLFFVAATFEWLNLIKKNYLIKLIGIIVLLISFFSAYLLREKFGINFFIFILLICIFTDLGGYVFGNILKGPKLTKISPNKTYAGVIGSFLASLLVGIFYIKFLDNEFILKYPLQIIFFILTISLVSQIGDLIISYFKRKAKIKDTGKILPGHGGILDRFDGLIFVLPIVYVFVLFIK